jgi:hypothetical protein
VTGPSLVALSRRNGFSPVRMSRFWSRATRYLRPTWGGSVYWNR